jgi:uncharacterized membrane protein YphA (DoxX/SURF4 family)
MNKKNLTNIGRIFYGLAIVGIGVLHFLFKGFRGLLSAIQPENPDNISIVIYIFGLYFILSGILIIIEKKVKITAIVLAYVLILFLVIAHLPKRFNEPQQELGLWTNVFKLLSFIGGAFLVSTSSSEQISNKYLSKLARLAPFGKYFFSLMLIAFGIDHFIYLDFVRGLVPKWMPFPVFWTHFTGVALFGAGLSILINFEIKIICQLLAIMLFIWLWTVHFRLALRYPQWNNGENITACFQCLAFTGIAMLIAATEKKERKNE